MRRCFFKFDLKIFTWATSDSSDVKNYNVCADSERFSYLLLEVPVVAGKYPNGTRVRLSSLPLYLQGGEPKLRLLQVFNQSCSVPCVLSQISRKVTSSNKK